MGVCDCVSSGVMGLTDNSGQFLPPKVQVVDHSVVSSPSLVPVYTQYILI